jgi:hypothetical protein
MPTWNANGRGSIDVDPLTVNKNGTQSDFQPRSDPNHGSGANSEL